MCEKCLMTQAEINFYLSTELPLLIEDRNPNVFDVLAGHNSNKMLQCLMLGKIWKKAFKLTSIVKQYRLGKTWLFPVLQKVDLVKIACSVLQWMTEENMEYDENYMDIIKLTNTILKQHDNRYRSCIPLESRYIMLCTASKVMRKIVSNKEIETLHDQMELDENHDNVSKKEMWKCVRKEFYNFLSLAIHNVRVPDPIDLTSVVQYGSSEFLSIISLIECNMEEDTLGVIFNEVSPLLSSWLSMCTMLIGKGVLLHQQFCGFQSCLDAIEKIVIAVLKKNIPIDYIFVIKILRSLWKCTESTMHYQTCLDFVLRNSENVVRCMHGEDLGKTAFLDGTISDFPSIFLIDDLLVHGLETLCEFLFHTEDQKEIVCDIILRKCIEMRNNYNVFDLVATHVERISSCDVYVKCELLVATSKFITHMNNKLSTWPPPLIELISTTRLSDILLVALHHYTNIENIDMNETQSVTNREMTVLVRNAAKCLIRISPEILEISFTMAKICHRPRDCLAEIREEFARTNLESLKKTIFEIENGEHDETFQKYFVQPRLNHKRAPLISLETAANSIVLDLELKDYSILQNYSEQIHFSAVWEKCVKNDLLM